MSMFGGQDEKKGAKTGIDLAKGATRRQQAGITLRNKSRGEMMKNKRKMGGEEETGLVAPESAMDPMAYTSASRPTAIPVALLPQFVAMCNGADPQYQYHGTLMIRKLLSIEDDAPIEQVITSQVAKKFVEFLTRGDMPTLQFEAAWALTNIASGLPEHTAYVMSINAAPYLVQLLSSPDDSCKEQATWALGNLAGDNYRNRDYVLDLGVVEPLLKILTQPCDLLGVHRNAVWALSNLCRSKPPPNLEKISPAIPVFVSLLHHNDDEIVMDAAWALSYISDGANERVQRLLLHNPISRVVGLLTSSNTGMVTPAIRIIGNVVTGSDHQTQMVINAGALSSFPYLLEHTRRGVRKEVCWTLSNVTAGTKEQIQSVINANLVEPLMQCMFANEFEVRKEAVWAVANLTCGASKEQIEYIVKIRALDYLCDLLNLYDSKIISVALEAIENILGWGEIVKKDGSLEVNPFADLLTRNQGLQKLENLQAHSHQEIFNRSSLILEGYFESELESAPAEETPAAAPATDAFGFGGVQAPAQPYNL